MRSSNQLGTFLYYLFDDFTHEASASTTILVFPLEPMTLE